MNQFHPSASPSPSPHAAALEGHVGLRLASRLSQGADALPHDITERLRFARERALAVAAQHRHIAAAALAVPMVALSGRSAVLGGGPPPVWLRLVGALPLVVLVAGLVFIQHHYNNEQIAAAAEIDSALLADDLPPAAYGDPGFTEFLRNTEAP